MMTAISATIEPRRFGLYRLLSAALKAIASVARDRPRANRADLPPGFFRFPWP
jgi:hypothetical protein